MLLGRTFLYNLFPDAPFPCKLEGVLRVGHRIHSVWCLERRYKEIFDDYTAYKKWLAGCSIYAYAGDDKILIFSLRCITLAQKSFEALQRQEHVYHRYQAFSYNKELSMKEIQCLKEREFTCLSPSHSYTIESQRHYYQYIANETLKKIYKLFEAIFYLSDRLLDLVNVISPGAYTQQQIICEGVLVSDKFFKGVAQDYDLLTNRLKHITPLLSKIATQLGVKKSESSFEHLIKMVECNLSRLKEFNEAYEAFAGSVETFFKSKKFKSSVNALSHVFTGKLVYV